MFWRRKPKHYHVSLNEKFTMVNLPGIIKELICCHDMTFKTMVSTLEILIDAEQVEVERIIRDWLNEREDARNATTIENNIT